MQKLKETCLELAQSNLDMKNQITELSKKLQEKSQEIAKIQSVIQMVDSETPEMQSLFWKIHQQTLDLKKEIQNKTKESDVENLMNKLDQLQNDQEGLEEMMLSYMFNSKMRLKKVQKKQSHNQKENMSEISNCKSRRRRRKQNVSSVQKLSMSFMNDIQEDDDDLTFDEANRKMVITSISNQEQSNNFINDLFNFN